MPLRGRARPIEGADMRRAIRPEDLSRPAYLYGWAGPPLLSHQISIDSNPPRRATGVLLASFEEPETGTDETSESIASKAR